MARVKPMSPDQDETQSDADSSDHVEPDGAGINKDAGKPEEPGRHEDADQADSTDAKAEHDARVFTDESFSQLQSHPLIRWLPRRHR